MTHYGITIGMSRKIKKLEDKIKELEEENRKCNEKLRILGG